MILFRPLVADLRSMAARLVLAGGVSMLALSMAHAQEAAAPPEGDAGQAVELAPVVVEADTASAIGPDRGIVAKRSAGATKTSTPIATTPQSVSVVTRQQMDDQNVQSVAQALRYSPGIFTEYRGSSNLHDETIVRGFVYAPRFLDGLAYGSGSLGQVDPWLLERVELVRGPSSVLYGQASPGGIINMVTKRPTEQAFGEVQATVGNRDRLEGAFDVGGPLTDDGQFLYRLTGIASRFDLEQDFSKQERVAIAPALTWRPNDRTSLTVLANYQNDPEAGFRNFLPTVGVAYPGSLGYGRIPHGFFVSDPDFQNSEREQASIGYQLEHRLNDQVTLRQNARYTHLNAKYATLVFNTLLDDQITLTRFSSSDRQDLDQFVIDNQVEGIVETGPLEHTLLAGLDYRYNRLDSQLWRGFEVPDIVWTDPVYGVDAGSANLVTDQLTKSGQLGIYAQDQIEWQGLHLLFGGRYDWADTDVEDRLADDTSQDDRRFTGRAGVLYEFANGLAPYASYSTSFEPNLDSGAPGTGRFKPTTGEQYEVGLKYAPPGWNSLFTLALYDIRQQNVTTYDPDSGYNIQTGEIHNQGVELEARSQITDNLGIIGAYTYIDSEVTESAQTGVVGKTPTRIPGQQASAWLDYRFQDGIAKGLNLGGGVRYIGKSYGDSQNTYEVSSATLVDATIGYELGNLVERLNGARIQLNASNLFDEDYVASCAGIDACFYGSGRTVTASLSYRW